MACRPEPLRRQRPLLARHLVAVEVHHAVLLVVLARLHGGAEQPYRGLIQLADQPEIAEDAVSPEW